MADPRKRRINICDQPPKVGFLSCYVIPVVCVWSLDVFKVYHILLTFAYTFPGKGIWHSQY